jgi:hypothetical protein
MNKRQFKRITAGYKARIICGDKNYVGIIENLSETGVNVITDPIEATVDFAPGESIDLKIEVPSGETLNLHCKIKWASKIPPHGIRSRIGMEIIEPPWDKIAYFL